MILKITNIVRQPSKYGGYFYYIYFKDIETQKSYKTCVAENYRNYKNWRTIIETFDKTKKTLINNIRINNNLVDADSKPMIVENNDTDNQVNIFDILKGDKNEL